MKKSCILLVVMALALVAGARGDAVCLVISPSNAGVNDQVTLSAYDASGNWVDMRNYTGIEIGFDDSVYIYTGGGGLDVSSGDGVFTLTQAILNGYKFDCDFYSDSPPPNSTWFTLVNPSEPSPPFNSISEAIAAGGTCTPPPAGEVLYNGIVLPQAWPPEYGLIQYEPMPVPYLTNPPSVVPIDVGRQLFVDDFLVDTTDMTRTYHQADYYTEGNPVLTSTTAEELGSEGGARMAGPFSGGSWYDPADNLYKMWYTGGMAGIHTIDNLLYATSTDGKNWDRPNLDVYPVVLLQNFTCTPSNPSAGQQVTIAAFDQNNQQVDLAYYDRIEFCWGWGATVCVDTSSDITIDGNGGAVFTCTQAILDQDPHFKFLAQKTGSPSENEAFLLPFPFDTIARAGNSVYPFSEEDATPRDSVSILLDHDAPASERYKWFASEFPGGVTTLTYRTSPNGINWSAPQATKEIWGDRTTVFYNPFRDVWVCSQRTETILGERNRSYVEGTSAADLMNNVTYNFGNTATPPSVHWVGADYLDPHHTDPLWDFIEPQLYTLDAMPYESVMLGQFSIWTGPYNGDCGIYNVPKRCDILLGFSRDGFHWDRPDRTRFISSTWDPLSWRMGNVQSVVGTPLVVGDEMYFYFNGRPNPIPLGTDWDSNYQAGLAMLRRDGFASMDASGSTKTLTTRPVQFTGKYLYVNVDCPAGDLKVEVLNTSDQVISPFTLASCDAISDDTTRKRVTWGANDDLSALAGTPVKFRFSLTDGSLYAFWVSPDASGASYGYVGGGGPGFTGPRDTVGDGAQAVTVPDAVGLTQATAESSIVAAGLVVGTVSTNYSSTVPAGNVISQNPASGAQVSSGSSVDIVVSLGAAPVSVPNVVGQAQATAESNIVSAGLVVGNVTTAYSSTVSAGNVISQNPTSGTQVSSGSSVGIEVSLGAAPTVGDPACIVISPTTAGPGDLVTLTAYDSNNQFVDLTNWSLVETGPWNCPSDGIVQQADEDGTVTFELTDCWYNDVGWEFYVWNDAEQRGVELGLVGGSYPHSTVAAAIAAGGTCQ